MRDKILLKLMLVVVSFVAIIAIGFYFLSPPTLNQGEPVMLANNLFGWKYPSVKFPTTGLDALAYSDIRDPGGIPEGLPVRLKIPAISVDAAIEDALITTDGRMDVPAGNVNVAWFALGPNPGQIGSAVIGGHFGIDKGVPRVFYDLDKLKIGDKIYVIDDKGNTIAFVVRDIKLFDRNADATTVFTSSDGKAHLNLITCEGVWNQVNGTYPDRRVVFTDAIPLEDTIVPKIEPVNLFPRILGIGARGTDVAALQTVLEEKEFLMMPRGIAKGYFGVLTRMAVVRYQKSAGLPANGVFNTLTRISILATPTTTIPELPSTAISSAFMEYTQTFSDWETVVQFGEIFFANPMNALVTSTLLILIILMLIKIIKRKY